MSSSRAPFPITTTLICLATAALAAGCADEKNPVLPPSDVPGGLGGPGGTSTSSKTDSGTTEIDAGLAITAGDTDAATGDEEAPALVLGATCDLIQQDCRKGEGCYPIAGEGHCEPEGSVTYQGSCTVDEFRPTCSPGLTCIAQYGSSGWCLLLCDKLAPEPNPICGEQTPCVALPGFPTTSYMGYCLTIPS